MRRALSVAMLSALLVVAPAALAQHGRSAGHAGGFHGGFAARSGYGGFHGGYAAPRSFGQFASRFSGIAPRIYGASPNSVSTAPRYSMSPAYLSAYRSALNADRHGWDHRGRYHPAYNGYGGYAYPYGYVNSWELLPWGYSDLTGEDDDASTSQTTAQQHEEAEPQSEYGYAGPPDEGYPEDYAPPPPYQAIATPAAPIAAEPSLTLIFKDGHTQQIRNYVLTQNALLDMDQAASGRMTRIPLSSLNLPATEQAAQQAGLDFAPPAS